MWGAYLLGSGRVERTWMVVAGWLVTVPTGRVLAPASGACLSVSGVGGLAIAALPRRRQLGFALALMVVWGWI